MSLCREHGGYAPDKHALGLVPRHAGVTVRAVDADAPARSVWAVRRAGDTTRAADAMIEALRRAAYREGLGAAPSTP